MKFYHRGEIVKWLESSNRRLNIFSITPKLIFFIALFYSSLSFCLPIEVGQISLLLVHQSPTSTDDTAQRYILNLDSTISENNCGQDVWVGYLKSDADKAMYSTLLALAMANRPVKIQGTSADTCMAGGMLIRNVYPEW